MKRITLLTTVCLTLLLSATATTNAQTKWTLEQCIQYAWDNNISIQQQKLRSDQSANTFFQSKLNFIPSVGAHASYNVGWGLSKIQVKDTVRNISSDVYFDNTSQSISPSISASITLFEGLQKFHTIHRNKADYNTAMQEEERLRNEMSLQIAQAYLQVLLSKEVLSTAEKSRESVKQQRETTKKLVDAGSQSLGTLLEIEAQLASENVQYVTAQNQVDISYLTLRQLLDIEPNSEFDIVDPAIDIELVPRQESIDNLYNSALRLPQIKAAELRQESAKYNYAIAKSRYWPTISFSAFYGANAYYSNLLSSENFWTQLDNTANFGIGFNLSIPLFQNWTTVTGSKNAKLNLKIAELEVENSHKALYKEIQQATTDASAAYNKYNASEQNVTAIQESFRYTQQKFDVGMVTATDYTVAKNNLFKAQSDMLQAKYQYVFQLKIIDFYKGIPIKL